MAFPQGYDTSRVLPIAYTCAPPPVVVPAGFPQGRHHVRRSNGRLVQRHSGPANIETYAPGYCPGSYTAYPQGVPGNPVITESVEQVRKAAAAAAAPAPVQFLSTQVHLFRPSKNIQGCFELFGHLYCPGK